MRGGSGGDCSVGQSASDCGDEDGARLSAPLLLKEKTAAARTIPLIINTLQVRDFCINV